MNTIQIYLKRLVGNCFRKVVKLYDSNTKEILRKVTEAQFGYCPLVWMFHGRVLNWKINRLHECSLQIVYRDSIGLFHELLKTNYSFTIHHRNIQSLAIKLYKINGTLSNEIISSISPPRLIKCNLRTQSDFLRNSLNSGKYGLN